MTHGQTISAHSTPLLTPTWEDIRTPRLDLVAVTPESLHIQQRDSPEMRIELGALLGAEVPGEWPHENWEPHIFAYLLDLFASDPEAVGWCRYILLRRETGRTLIGSFGSGFPSRRPERLRSATGFYPAGSARALRLRQLRPCFRGCKRAARYTLLWPRHFLIFAAPFAFWKRAASSLLALASKREQYSFADCLSPVLLADE